MPNRYAGVVFTLLLVGGFVLGLFLEPSESQANPEIGWNAEYFANPLLEGSPTAVTIDELINMNWSVGAPYENIPSDYFSVRWTINLEFETGVYRFRLGGDDTTRFFINDRLVLQNESPGVFSIITRDINIPAGDYQFRVEYIEETGMADVLFDWEHAVNPQDIFELDADSRTAAVEQLPPQVRITQTSAAVTTAPHPFAERLTQVLRYQNFPLVGVSPDGAWYQIALQEDVWGWIPSGAALAISSEMVNPTEDFADIQAHSGTAASTLQLRPAPFAQEVVGVVPAAASFELQGRNAANTWLYVVWVDDTNNQLIEGWAFSPYIHLESGQLRTLPLRPE